jgi:kynurenine formamidase
MRPPNPLLQEREPVRLINLTLPLYPFMPVGNVWAWDSPFQRRDITTYETHGLNLYEMSFHSETGTRLMLRACYDKRAPSVSDLDYGDFVNRDTIVVDIPKQDFEEILPEDIDATLAQDPGFQVGDAVLLRTGWGDAERYRFMGDQYAIRTPHFSVAGAERLIEVMKRKGATLLLTDCAYVGNTGEKYMRHEWALRAPWDRPPFPSQQARIYLRYYTTDRGRGGGAPDWAASVPLHHNLLLVAALANCGAILKKRIKVTVLPLFMEGAAGAPCSVIAIED